jgi:hypothetical protein
MMRNDEKSRTMAPGHGGRLPGVRRAYLRGGSLSMLHLEALRSTSERSGKRLRSGIIRCLMPTAKAGR